MKKLYGKKVVRFTSLLESFPNQHIIFQVCIAYDYSPNSEIKSFEEAFESEHGYRVRFLLYKVYTYLLG